MHEDRGRIIDFQAARALRQGAPPLPPASSYIPDWEVSLVALNRQPRGIEKYVWSLKHILAWIGGEAGPDSVAMADITYAVMDAYNNHLAARGCAASTQINDLAVMRSFCRWARRKGLRSDDPTDNIARPKKDEDMPDALDDVDLDALLLAINAIPERLTALQCWYWMRNRRAIHCFLLTGLRLSELADLRWSDIHLRQRSLIVRHGKGGRSGSVPMCDELIEELERVPEHERQPSWAVIPRAIRGKYAGQPLTDKGMEHIFDRWLTTTVGVERVRAHRLRHTFASQLLYNDVDIRRIQRLMRHRNLNTTQRYLKLRDKDLDDAVNTLTLKR